MAQATTLKGGRSGAQSRPANAVEMTGMQKMASRMWAPWIVMGLTIVGIAFIIGIVNSGTVADYFSQSKEVRESAAAGTALVTAKGSSEAIKGWLPGFKFFGLGLMLGGITFLLATILGNLRVAGGNVQAALGAEVVVPKQPLSARLFPMLMMMGVMILIATMFIGAYVGVQAGSYWNHSIASELNPAGEGSSLLAQLGRIHAIKAWVTPLKFVGMAVLFAGIALALMTIVSVLRFQARRLVEIASKAN